MPYWTGTHWESDAPAPKARPSRVRHILEVVAEGTLIAMLVAGLVAGTTFAGAKAESSVWVDGPDGARSPGLAYGQPFRAGYSTSARQPWVQARCYPNGSTEFRKRYDDGSIWGQNFSVYAGGPAPQEFELIDPIAENWTGGGADCVLLLVKYSNDYSRYTVLATRDFSVDP